MARLLGKMDLFVEVDFFGESHTAPGDFQAGHNQRCVGGVITADDIQWFHAADLVLTECQIRAIEFAIAVAVVQVELIAFKPIGDKGVVVVVCSTPSATSQASSRAPALT